MEIKLMSFRKLLLAGATLAMSTTAIAPAHASIVDRPHFKVLGVVIVWASDNTVAGGAPIATDIIINDDAASADTDMIGGTAVDGSTTFETINTESPSGFSAFNVDGASLSGQALTYNSSFYVASNTAFSINGQASVENQSGDFDLDTIGYDLDVMVNGTDGSITFGGSAQNPNGTFPAIADLSELNTATPVFQGDRRTAAATGAIVDQSVRFDATYTLGAGGAYDLSQGAGEIEAAVVYTVFVP